MISAFFKALGDLGDPRMRSILWQTIGLSIITAMLLWSGLSWLLSSTQLIGDVPLVGGWLETAVDWLGSIAVFAPGISLMWKRRVPCAAGRNPLAVAHIIERKAS